MHECLTSVNMKRDQETQRYNGNIWMRTPSYKQRRKWRKSHIINTLLTSFARSVRENIYLLNFSHRPRSFVALVCTKTWGKYFPVQTSHLVITTYRVRWLIQYCTFEVEVKDSGMHLTALCILREKFKENVKVENVSMIKKAVKQCVPALKPYTLLLIIIWK